MSIERGRSTWLLYLATVCWGWTVYAFGPSVPLLGEEAGYSAALTGLHGTGLAMGGLAAGVLQDRLVRTLTRRGVLYCGGLTLCVGIAVITTGSVVSVTLLGALLVGLGGSLVVNVGSAALMQMHGARGSSALSEANSLAAFAGALAPLLIASSVAAGFGWRVGLIVVVPALLMLGVIFRSTPVPSAAASAAGRLPRLRPPFWWTWAAFVGLIGVEFSISIWGSVLVAERADAPLRSATFTLTAFVLGIAVGRAVGSRLALRIGNGRLLLAAIVVAFVGWFVVWTSGALVVGAVGMLIAGLGVSLHFPLGMSRMLSFADGQGDRATGLAAVGAGVSIGLAPFALGWLADRVGIEGAFIVVPVLLGFATLALVGSSRAATVPGG